MLPWLSWLEHRVHIAGVVGSSPTGSTTYGALAQLVARLNGIQKVRGSTPLCSTTKHSALAGCFSHVGSRGVEGLEVNDAPVERQSRPRPSPQARIDSPMLYHKHSVLGWVLFSCRE